MPLRHLAIALGVLAALFFAARAQAQTTVIDDFADVSAWTVAPSDGVRASIAGAPGVQGGAMRIDFDFERGSGFVIVRRAVSADLPSNYRFSYSVKGPAPTNTLEFKLIDASGQNVWWVNQRDFEFTADWRTLSHKPRHISFAWGPSSAPLRAISAIEFAITASKGGKGSVLIDDLTLTLLPDPSPTPPPVLLRANGTDPASPLRDSIAPNGDVSWRTDPAVAEPSLELDFQGPREVGGLVLFWNSNFARHYDIDLRDAQGSWTTVARVRGSNGGRDDLPIPDLSPSGLRLRVVEPAGPRGSLALDVVEFMPVECADSPNALIEFLGRASTRGLWPRYATGEPTAWTVIGVPGDTNEALMNPDGAVEVGKGMFLIEPAMSVGRNVVAWPEARPTPWLADSWIPVPSVRFEWARVTLTTTAFAAGEPGRSTLYLRHIIANRANTGAKGCLTLAVRPLQVYPSYQGLNCTGGHAPIRSIRKSPAGVIVNDAREIRCITPPDHFGATTFLGIDAAEWRNQREFPPAGSASDPLGLASGLLGYDFDLRPGESKEVWTAIAMHEGPAPADIAQSPEQAAALLGAVLERWRSMMGAVSLTLPKSARPIADTLRSTIAYILINADGPSIQPGSRAYERSWIRDGAMTADTLLAFGFEDQVRDFLDCFAPFQYDSGKIPCCVDARGPDPVPEHDSHGQYIYAVAQYVRATDDDAFLRRHWPRVVRAVDYIQSLREQRLTPAYRDGPPEERAKVGLVPESISHEGYSAKPMHSYWDCFFVYRGLADAAELAQRTGDQPQLERIARLRDEFAQSLQASVALAMRTKGIEYVPGCVELGDLDPTSTAIALSPCQATHLLPAGALERTFERYWKNFTDRRDAKVHWNDYTPYELRVCSAMVLLGHPERAHQMFDYFFADRSPPAWNQWPEIVRRDKLTGRFIGDMPHTWVASDFASAVRVCLEFWRESDRALVIAAGVPASWVEQDSGMAIKGLRTAFGPLAYSISGTAQQWTVSIDALTRLPDGGVVVSLPRDKPIASATINEQAADIDGHQVRVVALPARVVITFAP